MGRVCLFLCALATNLSSNAEQGTLVFQAASGAVGTLRFSSDGRSLFAAGGREFGAWDLKTGKPLVLRTDKDDLRHSGFVLAPNCTALARFDRRLPGYRVVLLNALTLKEEKDYPGCSGGIWFSNDGKLLATGGEAGQPNTMKVWDLATGKANLFFDKEKAGKRDQIRVAAISPDRRVLATGGNDGQVVLWDIATQTIKSRYREKAPVDALCFSPDSTCIAVAAHQTAYVRTLNNGKAVEFAGKRLERGARRSVGKVRCFAFSPDGKRIAVGGTFCLVYYSGILAIHSEYSGHGGEIACMTFSPDGARLATASKENRIRVWKIRAD